MSNVHENSQWDGGDGLDSKVEKIYGTWTVPTLLTKNDERDGHDYVPVQAAAGIVCAAESHASGYVHPATVVNPLAVSALLNQPSPTSTLFVGAGVSVGGGSVGIVAVAV